MNRSILAVCASAAALAVALTACSARSNGGTSKTSAASGGAASPITLAMIGPTSGVDDVDFLTDTTGAQLAIDQINKAGGVLGGTQLKLRVVPAPADNAQAASVVRGLSADGIKIMSGGNTTPLCTAIAPVADQLKIFNVSSSCASTTLLGPNRTSKGYTGFLANGVMIGNTLAQAAIKNYPAINDWYQVGYDTQATNQVWSTAKAALQANGAITVGSESLVPTTQDDFRAVVTALSAKVGNDSTKQGLMLTTYGDGTTTFLKQAAAAGLLSKFAFIGTPFSYYESAVAFGGTAPSVWNAYVYPSYQVLKGQADNDAFVAAYKAQTGNYPEDNAYLGYIWAMAMAKTITAAGGVDYDKLLAAEETVSFKTITGEVTFDSTDHTFLIPVVAADLVGDPSSPDKVGVLKSTIVPGATAFGK